MNEAANFIDHDFTSDLILGLIKFELAFFFLYIEYDSSSVV